jgi:hypothetical protein
MRPDINSPAGQAAGRKKPGGAPTDWLQVKINSDTEEKKAKHTVKGLWSWF